MMMAINVPDAFAIIGDHCSVPSEHAPLAVLMVLLPRGLGRRTVS